MFHPLHVLGMNDDLWIEVVAIIYTCPVFIFFTKASFA